jgi:hypothetical protein
VWQSCTSSFVAMFAYKSSFAESAR